mmetsp:Transcript_10501/g.25690  ORF Transcript_10501/g.25690 Transcript_10501/m.25690 type:complete len:202 (-) Transcript_10501:828-1433(-)
MIWFPLRISPALAETRSSARAAVARASSSALTMDNLWDSALSSRPLITFIISSLSFSCCSSHSTLRLFCAVLFSRSCHPWSRSLFVLRRPLSSSLVVLSSDSATLRRKETSDILLSILYLASISSRARVSSSSLRLVSEFIVLRNPLSAAPRSPSIRVFVFSSSSIAIFFSCAVSSSSRACVAFSARPDRSCWVVRSAIAE